MELNSEIEKFEYLEGNWRNFTQSHYCIRVPSGINSEKVLFDLFAEKGGFPYFGYNWDALDECLSDFQWLDHKYDEVVIFHEDLPFNKDRKLQLLYIDTLAYASSNFRRLSKKSEIESSIPLYKSRRLVIAFPKRFEKIIRNLHLTSKSKFDGLHL